MYLLRQNRMAPIRVGLRNTVWCITVGTESCIRKIQTEAVLPTQRRRNTGPDWIRIMTVLLRRFGSRTFNFTVIINVQ